MYLQVISEVSVISKVLIGAVSEHGKKTTATKTFTLRNVNSAVITSCSQLQALIRNQISSDIIKSDFDVEYIQGSSIVVSIRNEDLAEIWDSDDLSEDEVPSLKRSHKTTEEQLSKIIEELKRLHGENLLQCSMESAGLNS